MWEGAGPRLWPRFFLLTTLVSLLARPEPGGEAFDGLAVLEVLGHFDDVANDQQFTAVGYGGQEAVNQPGGPVIEYLDTREYAVSTFNAVGPTYLRLSQNPATAVPVPATPAARTSWARAWRRPISSRASRLPATLFARRRT